MHTSRLARLAGSVAALILLLSLGASAALAKEGVSVSLAAPIPHDAQPGDVVPVFFRLEAITDTGTTPLRGSDVFIRLHGPDGAVTEASGAEQREAGLYKALIAIPAGGAAGAEFGMRGSATDASGKTVASDIVWPYDGILVAAAVPPPVDPGTFQMPGAKPARVDPGTAAAPGSTDASAGTAAAGTVAVDPRLALVVAVASGLAIAGAYVLGRRRIHGSPA